MTIFFSSFTASGNVNGQKLMIKFHETDNNLGKIWEIKKNSINKIFFELLIVALIQICILNYKPSQKEINFLHF